MGNILEVSCVFQPKTSSPKQAGTRVLDSHDQVTFNAYGNGLLEELIHGIC